VNNIPQTQSPPNSRARSATTRPLDVGVVADEFKDDRVSDVITYHDDDKTLATVYCAMARTG
jgi:hypothetical protein